MCRSLTLRRELLLQQQAPQRELLLQQQALQRELLLQQQALQRELLQLALPQLPLLCCFNCFFWAAFDLGHAWIEIPNQLDQRYWRLVAIPESGTRIRGSRWAPLVTLCVLTKQALEGILIFTHRRARRMK